MKLKIVVEITARAGLEYAALLSAPEQTDGRLRLTTIVPDQTEATVRLFLSRGEKLTHFLDIELAGLADEAGARPQILLSGRLDESGNADFRVAMKGRAPISAAYPLKKSLNRKRNILLAITLPALLVLGAAAFFVFGSPREAAPLASSSPPSPSPTPPPPSRSSPPPAMRAQPSVSKQAETAAALIEGKISVYFTPDDYALSAEAETRLDEILASILKNNPRLKVVISGHCALYGNESGRAWISENRAEEVRSYLESAGWKPTNRPELKGLGAGRPISRDPAEQHLNRRVEISYTQK